MIFSDRHRGYFLADNYRYILRVQPFHWHRLIYHTSSFVVHNDMCNHYLGNSYKEHVLLEGKLIQYGQFIQADILLQS